MACIASRKLTYSIRRENILSSEEVTDEEKANEAIRRMLFGKSADKFQKYLPVILRLWGIEVKGKEE